MCPINGTRNSGSWDLTISDTWKRQSKEIWMDSFGGTTQTMAWAANSWKSDRSVNVKHSWACHGESEETSLFIGGEQDRRALLLVRLHTPNEDNQWPTPRAAPAVPLVKMPFLFKMDKFSSANMGKQSALPVVLMNAFVSHHSPSDSCYGYPLSSRNRRWSLRVNNRFGERPAGAGGGEDKGRPLSVVSGRERPPNQNHPNWKQSEVGWHQPLTRVGIGLSHRTCVCARVCTCCVPACVCACVCVRPWVWSPAPQKQNLSPVNSLQREGGFILVWCHPKGHPLMPPAPYGTWARVSHFWLPYC